MWYHALQNNQIKGAQNMKPFPSSPFFFLWRYAKRNLPLFLLIAVLYIGSSLAEKLVPYYFSKLVDLFSGEAQYEAIKGSIFYYVVMIIFSGIAAKALDLAGITTSDVYFCPRVYKQIGLDTFDYLNHHSIEYFADNQAGALANNQQEITNTSYFYSGMLYFLVGLSGIVISLIMLFQVNVSYGLVLSGAILFSIFVLRYPSEYLKKYRSEMVKMRSKISGNLIDAMQNNFFVKIFGRYDYESRRAKRLMEEEGEVIKRTVRLENGMGQGEKLYFDIFTLIFWIYGVYLWREGKATGGEVVLILMLVNSIGRSVSFILHRWVVLSGYASEIRTNLVPFATLHDLTDKEDAKELKVTAGKIELRNVNFAYKDGNPVFKNFNLEIPPGQKIGVVGMSGGGKSTLIKLLQRFYDVNSGEIKIDGQNITDVTQESLHKAMSYIPQSSQMLERTIGENIAYGRPNATKEEIEQAAKDAFADEFIHELPNGYKTILNAQNQLSGGQMQRLSIARAILKDSQILLLDEATSALDSESEFYIQKAIENVIQDKTVLVVAHRLSTLKNMDRIIVIEKGKIVEDGTLNELIAKKGKFYKYWKLQKQKGGKNEG